MAVRQQHHANGSVSIQVEAALLSPPNSPSSPDGAPADAPAELEQGELLLELSGPGGDGRWEARQTVTLTASGAQGSSGGSSCSGSASEPGVGPADSTSSAARPAPAPVCRSLSLLLEQPQLWWPHDLGEQPLYKLRLTYTPSSSGSGTAAAPAAEAAAATEAGGGGGSSQSSSLSRRIGLRRVELVTDPLPGGAESFCFRVNGQPLYARGETAQRAHRCRCWAPQPVQPCFDLQPACSLPLAVAGANLVPAHVFEPAVTPAQLRRLVGDARAAHMNMLRVWGGGRYPQGAWQGGAGRGSGGLGSKAHAVAARLPLCRRPSASTLPTPLSI